MSHTVTRKTAFHSIDAIEEAARRVGATIVGRNNHRLYSDTISGLGIQLPGWKYPVVVRENGEIAFDNYGGRWGDIEQLNEFSQQYAVAAIEQEAANQGYSYEVVGQENGEIHITVDVEGYGVEERD